MDYLALRHADSGKHKYIAKVPIKGTDKYRYFYDKDEYMAYLKDSKASDPNVSQKGETALTALFNKVEQALTSDKLNSAVYKVKEKMTEFYDGKESNIYDMHVGNYDEKIEKVRQTPEWKAIVERKDPEYVKKNSDGTTNYLIDDYVAKKKMPILDVVDDIVSNRPISVNKIEKDAVVAGVKQTARSAVSLGILAVGAATKFMLEKTKFGQGSYQDEMEDAKKKVETGAKMVDQALETASEMDESDVQRATEMVVATKKAAETTDVSQPLNEGRVVEAAKLIMESDQMPAEVKNNDYYKTAENTLSNLSDEELALLSALLANMRRS